MKMKFYMVMFASGAMLLSSCIADYIDIEDAKDATENSALDVQVVNVTVQGESDSVTDTKTSLDPSSSAAFYWSDEEYITGVDMTGGGYHTSASTKKYELASSVSSVTNAAWFTFAMPVIGLDKTNSESLGRMNFYAYTPSREYNDRYEDMIMLAHTSPSKTSTVNINYDTDYLLVNHHPNRYFNINVNDTVEEAYHMFGRYLPFVAIPLLDKYVSWTDYDDDYAAETGMSGIATFIDDVKLNFVPLFHTVMVRIYPYQVETASSSLNGEWTGKFIDMDVHKTVTTVTLTDDNSFRTIDMFNMKEMVYDNSISDMIDLSRVDLSSAEKTGTYFFDEDYEYVTAQDDTQSVSTTVYYYDGDKNTDTSAEDAEICMTFRRAEGYDYMAIPVIATRSTDVVRAFNVNVKFYDKSDKLLLEINRDVTDASDTQDHWYYGSQSIVRIYEDETEMGAGYGAFTYYE
ncbi:MAG: hypothetical protein SNG38_01640 [Rikenellaceae bacterium]